MPNRESGIEHLIENVAMNASLKIWLWTPDEENALVHLTDKVALKA